MWLVLEWNFAVVYAVQNGCKKRGLSLDLYTTIDYV
jgi:hypothetical protein